MSDYKEEEEEEKGRRHLPKFGDWDVNNPSSAQGYTVIFNKARNDKKTASSVATPPPNLHPTTTILQSSAKPQTKKWFCCMQIPPAES